MIKHLHSLQKKIKIKGSANKETWYLELFTLDVRYFKYALLSTKSYME